MKQTIRRLTISICIAALFLTGMPAVFSAEDTGMSCDKLTGIPLYHDSESGGIRIELPADDFNSRGYAYGDSVNVTFSNGYALQDLPYYNGYYVVTSAFARRGNIWMSRRLVTFIMAMTGPAIRAMRYLQTFGV